MSIKPLKIKNKLHDALNAKPKFATSFEYNGESVECGDPRATRAAIALMDLNAVNGGAASHWGGPAAMSEMMSAIHAHMFKNTNWFDHYNYVNDIGHAENGIYALRANLGFGGMSFDDLKGFRSIESKLTGHGESHLYPEGVLLSNGPLGSALPQAQGLAIADKLMGNTRKTICTMSDGAFMEGEAKEAISAIPGLVSKGKSNPFILIISDNNTKLSGRIDADSFSMEPSFNAMEALGWNVIKVDDGHDIQACYKAMDQAINTDSSKPTFIWLKTIKGYGVKSTMDTASGGHGFPLKAYSEDIHTFLAEIYNNEEVPAEFTNWASELTIKPEAKPSSGPSVKKEKVQAGLAVGAINAKHAGHPVVCVSADVQGSTGMAPFHKEFPESSFDIGIAESNMINVAAGMSKAGYIPIVDTFAAFGVTKGNLPLIMASLSEAPVIAVFSHAGLQDAADGASHQSLTYISALSSIPNTEVILCASSSEAQALMEQAIGSIATDRINDVHAKSYVFIVGREGFAIQIEGEGGYHLGDSNYIIKGSDILIAAAGPMVPKALEAASILKNDGISAGVLNIHNVNSPDVENISAYLEECGSKLITIEDHQLKAGMGAQLIHALKDMGCEFKSKSLGIKGHFGQSAYSADELYNKYGIGVNDILKTVKEL